MDDDDQRWINSQRQRYQPAAGQPGAAAAARRLPNSDAVLNCPACMSLLCLDCQRSEQRTDTWYVHNTHTCIHHGDQGVGPPTWQNLKKSGNFTLVRKKSGNCGLPVMIHADVCWYTNTHTVTVIHSHLCLTLSCGYLWSNACHHHLHWLHVLERVNFKLALISDLWHIDYCNVWRQSTWIDSFRYQIYQVVAACGRHLHFSCSFRSTVWQPSAVASFLLQHPSSGTHCLPTSSLHHLSLRFDNG